jgi:hypothetical protein
MSNPSITMKKREKVQSKGQQQEKTYKQDIHGMNTKLSQRESTAPKGQALEWELYVHS